MGETISDFRLQISDCNFKLKNHAETHTRLPAGRGAEKRKIYFRFEISDFEIEGKGFEPESSFPSLRQIKGLKICESRCPNRVSGA
jgi:hypothetical protein